MSNSRREWAAAMRFFEVNPQASAEDALAEIQLLAERGSTENCRDNEEGHEEA